MSHQAHQIDHARGLLAELWGKADSAVGGWHPAILHMLDVASVALELLAEGLPRALVADLRAPVPGVRLTDAEIALVVACHDLGKLSPGFQAKVAERRRRLVDLGFPFPDIAERSHAAVTVAVAPRLLEDAGASHDAAELAAFAVGAHHGRLYTDIEQAPLDSRYGGGLWRVARNAAIPVLAEALGADLRQLGGWPSERWLMALAGLTVLSDWIGSDVSLFYYAPTELPSAAYVQSRRSVAAEALDRFGWRGWAAATESPSFETLFPTFAPNPMQTAVAAAAAGLEGPGLILVESATGGGKTEAALLAAEVQMARFGLGGLYFALPTQATSNQMLGRVREFLKRRYPTSHVNLHLLHALRDLEPGYAALRPQSVDGPEESTAPMSSVVADAWFHGKKRGLLSPFAVGTVDQALLAALQVKHFQLRMLGLCRKVVVIDEVHAYDAFMSRILDRLLQWLSCLGSSVVLLSATLPRKRRQELVSAWTGQSMVVDAAYPRVTSGSRGGESRVVAIARSGVSRTTRLGWLPAAHDAVASHLVAEVADGGCAAWICNTVGSAQAAYRALARQGWPVADRVLFHARFPIGERLSRERRVLGALDKEATRPHRLIVVATQVVEQSLDIDFDVMVSELAPIDLLIQRVGRVHRHAHRSARRPAGLQTPTLWVALDGADGEALHFGPSAWVYHEHVLLRTWHALRGRSSWTLPDEADSLVEAVYGDVEPPAEPPWLAVAWRTSGRDLKNVLDAAEASGSRHLVPKPSAPGSEESFLGSNLVEQLDEPDDAPGKHRDLLARTRDIEASMTLVCLAEGPCGPVLARDDPRPVALSGEPPPPAMVAALLRRSVAVQHRGWLHRLLAIPATPAWAKVATLRTARAVVFDARGRADVGGRALRLDPELGLVLNAQEDNDD